MESFTRRVDAEDESDAATEFSSVSSSDNGFASSEGLHSEVLSINHNGEGVLTADSSVESMSPSPKRMAMIEGRI